MTTDTTTLPTPTPTLPMAEVAVHFEAWRAQKRRGERIPEQLWSEAIALVKDYGLSPVTRRLRLSGRDLNQRRAILAAADDGPACRGACEVRRIRAGGGCANAAPAVHAGLPGADPPRRAGLRIEPGDGIEPRAVLERFMEVG